MSDEQCNLRLQKLEMIAEQHEKLIESQGKVVKQISQLLNQVRWIGYGGIGMFAASKIGLLTILEKLI